jgi:isopenicillin N synthase-like dioxygenase
MAILNLPKYLPYLSNTDTHLSQFATAELQNTPLSFPGMLAAHAPLLTRFTQRSDKVTKALLHSLLTSLNKPELETTLTSNPGDSGLKFISAPTCARREDAPDTTHTDGGLITLLWCPLLSSQIRDPQTKEWAWVEPRDGCAIVNVADALQEATGGRLHSCVHRVAQPGDGVEVRVFLSYYLRPASTEA